MRAGVMGFHTSGLVVGPPAEPNNPILVSMQQGQDDATVDPEEVVALQVTQRL